MRDTAPPQWEDPVREVALVALQAAVLTRRIFLPATRRSDLSPGQCQVLLALALTDTAPAPQQAAPSLASLAVQLTLDPDDVHELLFELKAKRLVAVVEPDEEDELPQFHLTEKGWAAARRYTERAGRFLPGWPPPAPLRDA